MKFRVCNADTLAASSAGKPRRISGSSKLAGIGLPAGYQV
jgi:hypothetical protein